jgi:hypothetical protein
MHSLLHSLNGLRLFKHDQITQKLSMELAQELKQEYPRLKSNSISSRSDSISSPTKKPREFIEHTGKWVSTNVIQWSEAESIEATDSSYRTKLLHVVVLPE